MCKPHDHANWALKGYEEKSFIYMTYQFGEDALRPEWASSRSQLTGRPPRLFGVTTWKSAVSNYIRNYSRLADSTQTKFSTDYNYEN
ncbi:hypothetical protein TNCV_2902081 [Trichonephila clavipes]|nr:hypothetical protein TNCV_2902081 [Trichonephila clavipes]